MKEILFILLFVVYSSTNILISQIPDQFNYQAIIRNNAGSIVSNSNVSLRLSIISENIYGGSVFVETHSLTTNQQGMVNLMVGSGNPVIGSINTINWEEDIFFLKVELDESGGTDYTDLGTTQLFSVPYALHSKTAGNVFSGNYQDLSNQPDFNGWDLNTNNDFDGNYSSLIGAPSDLSDFTNDKGYVSANDFTGWDQDATDDFSGDFNDLTNVPAEFLDGDDDTQLFETQVETYITNSPIDLAEGSMVNNKVINDWNSLQNIPAEIADGDDVLTEAEVDTFVSDNGYLSSEIDGDVANELQNLNQVLTMNNDAGGYQITNAGDPINNSDAATKQYVETVLSKIENLENIIDNGYITDYGVFVDSRDNNSYEWIRIGEQIWMAENLAYLPQVNSYNDGSLTDPLYYASRDYDGYDLDSSKNIPWYKTYGALYNWSAALLSCPEGWHLPSNSEWLELIDYLGGSAVAGGKMKEIGITHWFYPNRGATNQSGFTALGAGALHALGKNDYSGYWWTSTEYENNGAHMLKLNYEIADAIMSNFSKDNGFSVRCLKD